MYEHIGLLPKKMTENAYVFTTYIQWTVQWYIVSISHMFKLSRKRETQFH